MAPKFRVIIAKARILQLVVNRGNPLVCAVLTAAFQDRDAWLQAVHRDLLYLAEQTDKLVELRGASLAEWIKFLHANGKNGIRCLQEYARQITLEQGGTDVR